MLATQEDFAEQLGQMFQHYREALAPDFGCKREDEVNLSWESVPANERSLMVAAARLVLLELAVTGGVIEIDGQQDPVTAGGAEPGMSADDTNLRLGREGRECGC